MAVDAFIAEVSDGPECRSTTDLATELLRTGRELAAAQCRWLTLLAEFDRRAGWAADGALSCVDWVVWRVGLARSTAKEKLRVAHEIRAGPPFVTPSPRVTSRTRRYEPSPASSMPTPQPTADCSSSQ